VVSTITCLPAEHLNQSTALRGLHHQHKLVKDLVRLLMCPSHTYPLAFKCRTLFLVPGGSYFIINFE